MRNRRNKGCFLCSHVILGLVIIGAQTLAFLPVALPLTMCLATGAQHQPARPNGINTCPSIHRAPSLSPRVHVAATIFGLNGSIRTVRTAFGGDSRPAVSPRLGYRLVPQRLPPHGAAAALPPLLLPLCLEPCPFACIRLKPHRSLRARTVHCRRRQSSRPSHPAPHHWIPARSETNRRLRQLCPTHNWHPIFRIP
eukprot:SAG11_NODE_670_length_7823_cov_9.340886_5_plen_196_part_00